MKKRIQIFPGLYLPVSGANQHDDHHAEHDHQHDTERYGDEHHHHYYPRPPRKKTPTSRAFAWGYGIFALLAAIFYYWLLGGTRRIPYQKPAVVTADSVRVLKSGHSFLPEKVIGFAHKGDTFELQSVSADFCWVMTRGKQKFKDGTKRGTAFGYIQRKSLAIADSTLEKFGINDESRRRDSIRNAYLEDIKKHSVDRHKWKRH